MPATNRFGAGLMGNDSQRQITPQNADATEPAAIQVLAGSLNAALASDRRAMDEVAQAANTLPQLSTRFQQLASRAA